MTEKKDNASEVKDTDIVFECPFCGKSLAIDYRGAGLTIPCTDCGNHVEVPIPEGMEIVDVDSSGEEQEARIVNLRRALAAAEDRIARLEEELEAVRSRREALEASRTDNISRLKTVNESAAALERALDDAVRAASAIMQTSTESRS
jgi:transcription elongation factor Elf1